MKADVVELSQGDLDSLFGLLDRAIIHRQVGLAVEVGGEGFRFAGVEYRLSRAERCNGVVNIHISPGRFLELHNRMWRGVVEENNCELKSR